MELRISKRSSNKKIVVSYNKAAIVGNEVEVRMISEPNNLGNNTLRDMVEYYGNHYEINSVIVNEDELSFRCDSKELILKSYNDFWIIVNELVDCYDNYRDKFYKANKGISKILVLPSNISSYSIESDWLVFRVSLVGPTAISDSSFLKYLASDVCSKSSHAIDSIKIAEKVGDIDLGELMTFELDNNVIAFDKSLYKYFYNGYKKRVIEIGEEADIQHGIKTYEIKRRGDIDDSK